AGRGRGAYQRAAVHWRGGGKGGGGLGARLVWTSSPAGPSGNIGEGNYPAPQAGLGGFTHVASAELGRYGVTANAIAPAARTRMTEDLFPEAMRRPEHGFDVMAPENVSPVVVWLASAESKGVTGRVFEVMGGRLGVAEGWRHGPALQHDGAFEPGEVGAAVEELLAQAAAPTGLLGA